MYPKSERVIVPRTLPEYWAWLRKTYPDSVEALKVHRTSSVMLLAKGLLNHRDKEMWVLPGAHQRGDYQQYVEIAQKQNLTIVDK
jgi:hypothetical protein